MIGYALSHRSERSRLALRRGCGLLAVDELDLEGDEYRLGDGVIQARPNAAHGTPQPSRSQTSTQAAEVDSLPRSLRTASTSATTRWRG
jgi:hypothetical protein